MSEVRSLALLGNPNTGKTTLFNALTGLSQRTGNFPGCTVERKTGIFQVGPVTVEALDLPGTYSLAAVSPDELIVAEVLLHSREDVKPIDAVLVVADATSLYRNLYLVSQLMALNLPMVMALNMIDQAHERELTIDATALSKKLGFPVVATNASREAGLTELRQAIEKALLGEVPPSQFELFPEVTEAANGLAAKFAPQGARSPMAHHVFRAIMDEQGSAENMLAETYGPDFRGELAQTKRGLTERFGRLIEYEAKTRYAWIRGLLEDVVVKPGTDKITRSERFDKVLTHPVLGISILLAVLALVFQSIYSWANPFMEGIQGLVGALGQWFGGVLAPGILRSLVVDGIFEGVGAVVVFLPQIMFLFLFIALLEDCGYMARAAFMLDKIFNKSGLSGKSLIPMLSSFACAIPGLMATRSIEDRKDRFTTIFVAPLMSCSARLPVYVILIGALISDERLLGPITYQGLTLLAMYLVGVMVAVPTAWILKKTLLRGASPPFLMELPSYRIPSPRTVAIRVYSSGREFLARAGSVIMAVTIVVWALCYFPRSEEINARYEAARVEVESAFQADRMEALHAFAPERFTATMTPSQVDAALASMPELGNAIETVSREGQVAALSLPEDARIAAEALRNVIENYRKTLDNLDRLEKGDRLRHSWMGRMGHAIEPIVAPVGWDWRIGMAAIAAFPAREVLVSTLGIIFNLGEGQDEQSAELKAEIQAAVREDGSKLFNVPVALSIMVFFALCAQCASTLAVIKKETGSWRWPLLSFSYMTVIAYVFAFAAYHLTTMLGWGA